MSRTIPAATTKTKREKRSWNIALQGQAGTTLTVRAFVKKDASAHTCVIHQTQDAKGKKVRARGASEAHPTLAAAKVAQEKLVAQATKMGWEKKTAHHFAQKPDAFDARNLPAPVPAKPARR